MALPTWLDPWWHVDFEVNTSLAPDAVRDVLSNRTPRLSVRSRSDGRLVVVRRGGFMNQFVRAEAKPGNEARLAAAFCDSARLASAVR